MRRPFMFPATIAAAAILSVSLLAACGDGYGPSAIASQTQVAGECDEAAVREAITASGAVAPDLAFDITYLECAEGFGWAIIGGEGLDSATVLLRVSDTEIEVLNLGTSVCTADAGIPADVAAQIAPPGQDPAGDCPGTAQPDEPAEPDEPEVPAAPAVPAEPALTG